MTGQPKADALPSGELDRHLFLTRAMARRHGVSLSEAMHQGILDRADFATIVDLCRDCPGAPADCHDFVEDDDQATAAPDWCANKAVLEGLRDLV